MDHIHYFILSNTTYLLQLLILSLKLYDSSTNYQIQKKKKIQYKNESRVQVVRTSVNELGHKTSMQKTYNSLPVFTSFEHAYVGMQCCVPGKWFPHFEGMLSPSSSVQGP